MNLSGKVNRDSGGNILQTSTRFTTVGFEAPVTQVGNVTGAANATSLNVAVNVNSSGLAWPACNATPAVKQVSNITGNSDKTLQTITVTINATPISWVLPAGQTMAVAYTNLRALVNASGTPVTATFISPSYASEGILITANVGDVSFTCTLLNQTGTIATALVTASAPAVAPAMGAAYEELLATVNASIEPVTATYVDGANHALGIVLTADVCGKAFTCTLTNNTGTLAYSQPVDNKAPFSVPLQSPAPAGPAEIKVCAPRGATAVILRGDAPFVVDSVTGVGGSKGLNVVADVYVQLPIAEGDAIFLASAAGAGVDFAFLTLAV